MKKTKKFVAIIIFLLGFYLIAKIFYPGLDNHLQAITKRLGLEKVINQALISKDKLVNQFFKSNNQWQANQSKTSSVLGEYQIAVDNLTQELITEASQRVNKLITEKIEEAKDIPEKQLEEIKKEVKKEIYQGLCENWLQEVQND